MAVESDLAWRGALVEDVRATVGDRAVVIAVASTTELVELLDGGPGRMTVDGVFVFIGAQPRTAGSPGGSSETSGATSPRGTPPGGVAEPVASAFATSEPEVFAVGDVRTGSVKRVASAIGEGSIVVPAIHAYLDGRRRMASRSS